MTRSVRPLAWAPVAVVAAAACSHGLTPPAPPPPAPSTVPAASSPVPATPRTGLHFDLGAVDPHADPCASFYDYACGGWRASHPLPPDQAKWDLYAEMNAVNVERERALIEEAARAGAGAGEAQQRVGAYYTACMDEAGIEQRGIEPLRDVLAEIASIRTKKDVTRVLADLHAHWVEAGFSIVSGTDIHDARQRIAWIDKGALGLPDPGDYTGIDEATVTRRARYADHLTRLFRLLGDAEADATAAAKRTIAFETALAEHALTRVERRRRENLDHPMTVAELQKRYPSVDWRAYFAALGLSSIQRVNVSQPAWGDALERQLAAKDLRGLRDYLRTRVVRGYYHVLPRAIESEVFDFAQRTLRGKKAMASRSSRCIQMLDEDVGVDVGRLFVERYFEDDARARVRSMIDAVLAAYRADIDGAGWLGPEARAEARKKLDRMLVVTGMSNRPRPLDGLRIGPGDAFGNAWRSQARYVTWELSRIGKPVDREAFFDSLPQQLDGFGSKALNATGFTAGFLQPPLLDPQMDDAVSFGGLGSVIGHELSHQLDDEGRKYDAEGNLRDWWSADDVARYEERAQCFVDEYSRFHIEDGTAVDGRLTLGENIADNGGIRLSFAAVRPSDEGPRLDGFTPAQRFFLAWAQIRCENVTPEYARLLATTNEHAPGRFRVDGVVSNMPEFARAFSCRAGTPMAPEKRCAVW